MILRNTRPFTDPYALAARALGVESSAGENEIRTAYRRAAHDSHPDINKDNPHPALLNARFRLATAARALLLSRSGNQDVRPLLKDFQAAQQWYDQEAQKVRASAPPPPPPGAQAGPKPGPQPASTSYGPRPGGTSSGPRAQGTSHTSNQSDAFKNARSWVPPEFNTDDAHVHRSNAGGWRSATSDEAKNARAWTPPDLDAEKEKARASRAQAGGPTPRSDADPTPGAAPHGPTAGEKPRAESQGSHAGAFDPDDWNLGTPFGSAGTGQSARNEEAAARPQPPPEPAPAEPQKPPLSEAEVQRRKAQVNAYTSTPRSEHVGRNINLEI